MNRAWTNVLRRERRPRPPRHPRPIDLPCRYCGASPGTRCDRGGDGPHMARRADFARLTRIPDRAPPLPRLLSRRPRS